MQAQHQLVVQLAGVGGGRAGVEQVAGDQHRVDLLRHHLRQQPVDQRLMLGLPGLAHEMLAEVPVGGVEKAHGEDAERILETPDFTGK